MIKATREAVMAKIRQVFPKRKVADTVELARADYRDVLAWAQYRAWLEGR